MIRRLTWMSLVLLVVTLLYWYWAISIRFAPDFDSLGGQEDFKHQASVVFGGTELTWILAKRQLVIAVVTGPAHNDLPVLGRSDLNRLIGDKRWNWEFGPRIVIIPKFAGIVTFSGPFATRSLTLRLFWVRLWPLFPLFSLLPLIAVARSAWHRLWVCRVARIRRARLALGRCRCGYDLRHSRRKCPECGRAMRWVPVNVPPLRR